MHWYKAMNNITSDPALHLVAEKSKCYRHEVIAFWILLLEKASQKNDNGAIGEIDFEETDFTLGLLCGKSKKIFNSLIERGKIIDFTIKNWAKHQADTSNAERQRRFRERQKTNENNDDVTLRNVTVTQNNAVTQEEKRIDKIRIDKEVRKKEYPDWLDQFLWIDFVSHRKTMKAPLTKRAEDLAIGELFKLTQKGYSQKELIEKSILNGWKAFYEPKEQYANKSNNGKNYGASKSEQARAAVARGLAAFGVE